MVLFQVDSCGQSRQEVFRRALLSATVPASRTTKRHRLLRSRVLWLLLSLIAFHSSARSQTVSISTSSLPDAQAQVSYTATLTATGGTEPYFWEVVNGQLPKGLGLDPAGVISGTPTVAGAFTFTIQVTDADGQAASADLSLNIATAAPPPVRFGHVFIVVEENHGYSSVIGSPDMPFLNSLANRYGLATQYYANTHPSIGNYFMMTTGQILTNTDGMCPNTFPVSADNVVSKLLLNGKTWKVYAEDLPAVGSLSCGSGNYVARHNPFPYFTDVQNSSVQKQNLVPFQDPNAGFAHDLVNGTLPDFSFIVPNLCNDAHDCSLSVADNWLKLNIDPLIRSQGFQKDGLLIIVFDESGSDNTNGGGRVVAVLISPPSSKAAYQSSTLYQHQSVLRLMLEGLGVKTPPGAAATAPTMWEFFTFPPPS